MKESLMGEEGVGHIRGKWRAKSHVIIAPIVWYCLEFFTIWLILGKKKKIGIGVGIGLL